MKNGTNERMAQMSIVIKTLQGALNDQLDAIFAASAESEEIES